MRAVEKIRKLDFEHGVDATFLPRVELAKRAADLLLSDYPKREAAGIRRPLQRQLRSGQPHVAFEAPGGDERKALGDPKERVSSWAGGEVRLWSSAGDHAPWTCARRATRIRQLVRVGYRLVRRRIQRLGRRDEGRGMARARRCQARRSRPVFQGRGAARHRARYRYGARDRSVGIIHKRLARVRRPMRYLGHPGYVPATYGVSSAVRRRPNPSEPAEERS
jgi:hypothetical protein